MTAGAMMSRRLASRAVAAATPKRSWEVVCVAALMLMLLMAPGCGEDEYYYVDEESHPLHPCYNDGFLPNRDLFLHWTPDGSYLVVGADNEIWTLEVEGARLLQVADTRPYNTRGEAIAAPPAGFYADVSPDGSRIVYSTCEYHGGGYELATVNIDGTDKRRLTQDLYFEHNPVWSPDGRKIALLDFRLFSDPTLFTAPPGVDTYPRFGSDYAKLSILSMESGARRLLSAILRRGDVRRLEATSRLALSAPPVWSPDSERLAFIADEARRRGPLPPPATGVLHTIRADGSQLARIGKTTALPTWSSDGDELAYATVDGDVPALYAVRPDGTGRRLIWSGGADEGFAPISQVLWSPDGSEILFISDRALYVVSSTGGDPRDLGIPWGWFVPTARASWSPGGLKIAVHFPYERIVTVSRDGADLLILAEAESTPSRSFVYGIPRIENISPFRALDPPLAMTPPDRSYCSAAVAGLAANPGLIGDCETLLRIRNQLFGRGESGWTEDTPMAEWRGVVVDGDPLRVRALVLSSRDLRGFIPPDIANLTMLEWLSLSWNHLQGTIPPELGRLTNLVALSLGGNFSLQGGIPPELGDLTNLRSLVLETAFLGGAIPPELGKLQNVQGLYLGYNDLSGSIPAELSGMKSLAFLDLSGNSLSGCIPTQLPELWVKASGLKRCKPEGEDGS